MGDRTAMRSVLQDLRQSNVKVIVAIVFASGLEDFLDVAAELNMTGPDYVWIMPSSSVSASVVTRDGIVDPAALATRMQGMFTFRIGSPMNEPGFARYTDAWLAEGSAACVDNGVFDIMANNSIFEQTPSYAGAASWAYDATVAAALAFSRVADPTNGAAVFDELISGNVVFDGASGVVSLQLSERRALNTLVTVHNMVLESIEPLSLTGNEAGSFVISENQTQAPNSAPGCSLIAWTTNLTWGGGSKQQPLGHEECTAGQYWDSFSYSCAQCEPGTACDAGCVDSCTVCDAGYYSSSSGLSACLPCPAGEFADTAKSVHCSACSVGEHSVEGSPSCAECGTGIQCEGGILNGTYPGYWSETQPITPDNLANVTTWECLRPESCLGGVNSTCAQGYKSIVCAACVVDHWQYGAGSDSACFTCGSDATSPEDVTFRRHLLVSMFISGCVLSGWIVVGALAVSLKRKEDRDPRLGSRRNLTSPDTVKVASTQSLTVSEKGTSVDPAPSPPPSPPPLQQDDSSDTSGFLDNLNAVRQQMIATNVMPNPDQPQPDSGSTEAEQRDAQVPVADAASDATNGTTAAATAMDGGESRQKHRRRRTKQPDLSAKSPPQSSHDGDAHHRRRTKHLKNSTDEAPALVALAPAAPTVTAAASALAPVPLDQEGSCVAVSPMHHDVATTPTWVPYSASSSEIVSSPDAVAGDLTRIASGLGSSRAQTALEILARVLPDPDDDIVQLDIVEEEVAPASASDAEEAEHARGRHRHRRRAAGPKHPNRVRKAVKHSTGAASMLAQPRELEDGEKQMVVQLAMAIRDEMNDREIKRISSSGRLSQLRRNMTQRRLSGDDGLAAAMGALQVHTALASLPVRPDGGEGPNTLELRNIEAAAEAAGKKQKAALARVFARTFAKHREFLLPIGIILVGFYQVETMLLDISQASWMNVNQWVHSFYSDTSSTMDHASTWGILPRGLFTCKTHFDICDSTTMLCLGALAFFLSMPVGYLILVAIIPLLPRGSSAVPTYRRNFEIGDPTASRVFRVREMALKTRRKIRFGENNWKGNFLKDMVIKLSLLAMLVLQPNLANMVLRLYDCKQFDQLVLEDDVTVPCDGSSHKWCRRAVGPLFMLIYVIGIPCLFLGVLYLNASPQGITRHMRRWARKQASTQFTQGQITKLISESIERRFSILYDKYHVHNWYWEVIECARKLFLVSVVPLYGGENATAGATSSLQLTVALGTIGFFLVLQVAVQPFRVPSFNWLAIIAQLCSFATAALSLSYGAGITDTCDTELTLKFCAGSMMSFVLLIQLIPASVAFVLVFVQYYELISQSSLNLWDCLSNTAVSTKEQARSRLSSAYSPRWTKRQASLKTKSSEG